MMSKTTSIVVSYNNIANGEHDTENNSYDRYNNSISVFSIPD